MYFTNRGIKKGLKPFFEKENKEMPKLLNKSISLVASVVISTLVSNTLMKQFLLCASNASFGINDPVFGFDIAFYMFQKPFIQTLLLYFIGNKLGNTLESLCKLFDIPESIIGILLGFVTSIPELMTFFESQKHYKKEEDEMLGVVEATNNLLTSNILNLFAIQTIGILITAF